jgi:hypothetical protein
MSSNRVSRVMIALAGCAALVAIGSVAAGCATSEKLSPSTSTTTTTTTTATTPPPPVSPTEKGISPTGGNLFSPQVIAPPAPTEPPGIHRHRAG